VITVMNLQVPQKVTNFFTSLSTLASEQQLCTMQLVNPHEIMQITHRWHSETFTDVLPSMSQVLELLVVDLIDFTGSQEMACIVFIRPQNYNTKNFVLTEGK